MVISRFSISSFQFFISVNEYKSTGSDLLFLLAFSFSRWGSQRNNLLFISIMWAFSSPSKCTTEFFYGTLILSQNIWPSSILEPLWIYLLSLLLNHFQALPWVPFCLCECFFANEEIYCSSYFFLLLFLLFLHIQVNFLIA